MGMLDFLQGLGASPTGEEETTADKFPIGDLIDLESEGGSSGAYGSNSGAIRVPITDRNEAMSFAKTEWNKIRRGSGHELECQVFGSHHWQVGEWCKVYIPSMNEYTDMYVTKVDHSNDSGSEWLTNITLMDYAPQLSELDEETVQKLAEEESGTEDTKTNPNDNSGEKWSSVAQILQENYEKPDSSKSDGGWNDLIRAILAATSYDPTIKNILTKLTKKTSKNYVDVGHDLCDVVGIPY